MMNRMRYYMITVKGTTVVFSSFADAQEKEIVLTICRDIYSRFEERLCLGDQADQAKLEALEQIKSNFRAIGIKKIFEDFKDCRGPFAVNLVMDNKGFQVLA